MREDLLDAARIERDGAAWFGVPIWVAVATEPAKELSKAEAARLAELGSAERRESWRIGRRALKALLGRMGMDPDTAALRFPHPSISLTHTGRVGVAVGTPARLRGLGADLELEREVSAEAGRRFLSPQERGLPLSAKDRLRIWTVKEAAYKANPANHETTLADYRLARPHDLEGEAVLPHGTRFRTKTFEAGKAGFLSIAVLVGSGPNSA